MTLVDVPGQRPWRQLLSRRWSAGLRDGAVDLSPWEPRLTELVLGQATPATPHDLVELLTALLDGVAAQQSVLIVAERSVRRGHHGCR